MKVLIVDDEEMIRNVLREYIEFEGNEAYEAADGIQAVKMCRENDYDIVLMDVMMPRLDGFSAVKEIRKFKDIPVIMLSARGEEYDKLRAQAEPFREKFAAFSMGLPLLSSTEDMQEICRFYNKEFPREDGEALVLMGHGTTHFANAVYPAMNYIFSEMGFERIFVGAVEGYPDIEIVRKELKRLDVEKVTVTPLMLVAGDHAVNDMAGEEPDSWKSLLESDGFAVKTVVRGLGEYPAVREMYLAHIRRAMERE